MDMDMDYAKELEAAFNEWLKKTFVSQLDERTSAVFFNCFLAGSAFALNKALDRIQEKQ